VHKVKAYRSEELFVKNMHINTASLCNAGHFLTTL